MWSLWAIAQRYGDVDKRVLNYPAGLQLASVLGSQSIPTSGAGTISFLQNGQNAVATLLASMMDSDLKDISNWVAPG